jgi:hypothetical protein
VMADDQLLFADLPIQERSPFRETDEHFLEPCSRCGGRGKEENPFPRWHWRHFFWDPKCRKCNGAGKRLVFVGKVIDG